MVNCMMTIFIAVFLTGGNHPGLEKGEKYLLEYKLPRGTQFYFTYIRDDDYEQEYLGNFSKTRTIDTMEYLFSVENISQNDIAFQVTYHDFSTETDHPQITQPADYSALIGNKVNTLMTKQGENIKLEGFENLPVLNIPGKGELNEEKYRIAYQLLFPRLPSHPVRFGDLPLPLAP